MYLGLKVFEPFQGTNSENDFNLICLFFNLFQNLLLWPGFERAPDSSLRLFWPAEIGSPRMFSKTGGQTQQDEQTLRELPRPEHKYKQGKSQTQ